MGSPVVVFTGGANTGTIACKQCGKAKVVDITNFRNTKKNLKVKCSCGSIFDVVFETRRYHRKTVELPGKLLSCQSLQHLDEVTVNSISVGGVGFVTHLDTIRSGDMFAISFSLDDDAKALVEEEIVVRHVKNNEIGSEFAKKEKYNFDLDFYLMPFTIID